MEKSSPLSDWPSNQPGHRRCVEHIDKEACQVHVDVFCVKDVCSACLATALQNGQLAATSMYSMINGHAHVMCIVTDTRPTFTALNSQPRGGSQPSHQTDASRQQNGQPGHHGGVHLGALICLLA